MTKPLSEDFVEYFMPDGSSNLDLEIAIYKGIKALEASIKEKDKMIKGMRKCYVKLTDCGCNVEDDHWIYCADRKLMNEFDEAFEK